MSSWIFGFQYSEAPELAALQSPHRRRRQRCSVITGVPHLRATVSRRAPPPDTSALTITNGGATRKRRPKKRAEGGVTRRRQRAPSRNADTPPITDPLVTAPTSAPRPRCASPPVPGPACLTRSHHCRLHQITSPRPRNACARTDNAPDNTTLPRPHRYSPNNAERQVILPILGRHSFETAEGDSRSCEHE